MVYGYFDNPLQETPAYDPGLDVDCPVCYDRLSHPMKTISVMAVGDSKSYFYRVHKTCFESLSEEQAIELDSVIIGTVCRKEFLN